ncbi:Fc.00g047270.m01.CDS01 [Cosmosporella sp. VM-42]
MANNDSPEVKVGDFCAMSGATPEQATQYLEANDWNVPAAVNSYFQDEDEATEERRTREAADIPADYTGPRTLDGRPVPQAASSSGRPARKPAPSGQKKKGIATLGSLGGSSHHHDDDDDDDDDDFDDDGDDDGRGNLFAGGEKSGLAVQDPQQGGGPKKIINDILAKAKANARSNSGSEAGPSRETRFRGTGMTLGGEGEESRAIPDPRGGVPPNATPQERVLHIWQDGFSIDDGELRRFDDPANQVDLQMIRSGRAPLHLMNVNHDQPVDVKLHQHETPYTPQPKEYKPFGGSGQRLGSPVPGDGTQTSVSLDVAVAAPAPAASSSSSNPAAPTLDSAQPTLTIRIQLPDGTRLPARFNTTHTVEDVYGFVQGASADTRTRPWVLATTFPNKEHTDRSLVLGEMPEFKKGGTAVVKWT